jgi:uncharacterized membrane protein YfbV (UPF0208 family)
MGWLDRAWSGLKSAAGSVVSGVRDAVHTAVSWLANKGEAFIGTVKETYAKVKPHLEKTRPFFRHLADLAEKYVPYPWVKTAILAVDRVVAGLLALENSPVMKKVERAARWVIELAKRLDRKLTAMEEAEAREHQQAFREAKAGTQTAEQARAFDVAAMLNELALVKTGITNLIDEGGFAGYEHYLRLRATQKLMRTVEDALTTASSAEQISADDIFLVQVGAALLSDRPELGEEEAARLDGIVMARYGKRLMPFVFEEMSKLWQLALTDDERLWKRNAQTLAAAKAKMNRLKLEALVSPLSAEDQTALDGLAASLPAEIAANDDLMRRNVEREHYVSATEGFLQLLEKDHEELKASDQEYLLDQGQEVGLLLTECAQKDLRWADLGEEQRALIADFANIFRADSVKRGEALEVECNG